MRLSVLKIYLWLILSAAMFIPVRAQYSGGNSDGVAYAISACPSALIFKGGSYDGFANVTVFCWDGGAVARYTGGSYNGTSVQNSTYCAPVANVAEGGGYDGVSTATSGSCVPAIYAGGSYDGSAIAQFSPCNGTDVAVGGSYDGTAVASTTCTVTGPYAGGSYDGVSVASVGCTNPNIYTGGSYDGTSIQTQPCTPPPNICLGGSYDGFSSAVTACNNYNIFAGGSYDGTGFQVQNCTPNPNICTGGSYDGFSSVANSCTNYNVCAGGAYDGFSYALSACASYNVCVGGSYDGVAYAKAACAVGNIYAGGNYDGFANNTVFCWSTQSAHYTGGAYDGVSAGNVACSVTISNIAFGGSYDGVSTATSGTCTPVIYVGGSYDGASIATSGACTPTNVATGGSYDGFSVGTYSNCANQNAYAGGSYDGVSVATTGACTITNFYAGGSYDGFSSSTVACTPPNIFLGGQYDGYAAAVTNCSTPNPYVGGSYDGFSYLVTSCPPTASIYKGGSYDGFADNVINCTPVDPYVGGAYDGVSYMVTICCTPPTVTQQPVNDTVCSGANALFALNASSISGLVTYQWQENRGSGWNNITAGGVYGTPNTTSLALTNVPLSMTGYQYRCYLTVACGAFTYSNIDTLVVDQVNAAPPTANVCVGTTFTINGTPSGGMGGIVTNAWSIDSAGTTGVTAGNLSNTAAQTVTFNSSGLSGGRVLLFYAATDKRGCNVTAVDTVNLNAQPNVINFNIDSAAACQGYPAVARIFSVSLQNGTYLVNYVVSGANTGSGTATVVFANDRGIFTTSAAMANAGATKIKVTSIQLSSSGCSSSTPGDSLTFTVGQAPVITSYSPGTFSNTVCAGSNTYFGLTATGAFLTYSWQYSVNGGVSWLAVNDTGPYTGSSTSVLNIITNATLNGYEYRGIVTGECSPADTSIVGELNVGSVYISTQPAATTYGCTGDSAVVWISAQGVNLGYQWQYSSNSGSSWANLTNGGNFSGVNTDSLVLITSSLQAGYFFRCVVNTIACNPDTSSYSVLSLTTAPSISVYSPASFKDTVCAGTAANFALTTSGSGLAYQWQVSTDGGSTWSNISNSATYAGVLTPSLSITTTAALNQNQYRCVINGACPPVDTSNAALLVVGASSITAQPPASTYICSGTNGTISTTVAGNYLGYQWQVSTNSGSTWNNLTNNATYGNVTGASLSITNASTALNGYYYRCAITTLVCSTIYSNNSVLNIYVAPNITSTQSNHIICVGSNASFTVTASGTPAPTYQWMFNGVNIGGATAATYSITSATTANAGIYGVIVHNACATDTVYDTLTVNSAPAITAYTPTAFIDTVCGGGTALFGITTTGSGLTYQWQVSTNSGSTWTNISNGATYTGVTTDSLYIVTASSLDGYYYRCVVTSSSCSQILNSNAGILHVGAVGITTQPATSTVVCAGSNTTIAVVASGTYLQYVWQVSTNAGVTWTATTNGALYSGSSTATLGLASVPTSINGYQYRCVISTLACTGDTSNISTVTVNTAPAITAYSPATLNDTVCAGNTATISITATGTSLTYQWQVSTNSGGSYTNVSNGATYTGVTTNTLNIVSTSAMNLYYYRCVVSGTCNPAATSSAIILHVGAVAITTQPPASTAICVGATGSIATVASGTYLTYQWQLSTNSGVTWTNLSNTAPYSNVTTATMTLISVTTALNGNEYRCVISTVYCTGDTTNASTLTINTLPAVTSYTPASLADTVCAGSTATFAITATGTNITYQWQVSTNGGTSYSNVSNGATYSGATTNTLSIVTTAAMNTYLYRCVVSGTCPPAATSNAFILRVGSVSITTETPSSVSICTANNGSITIVVSGTYLSYQWLVSMDGGATWSVVTNGANYSGATTANLTLISITSGMGGYLYKVVASTLVCPNDTSTATTLTLAPPPAISNYNPSPFNNSICAGSNALFAITATNANAYQWQLSANSGTTWSNVSNTGVYSGATTDSLQITAATASMDGYFYRCIVQGNCLPYDTSATGILYVGAVSITSQPANSTICNGSNTSFTVGATGTHLTYQWQLSTNGGGSFSNITNGAPYSGATTATLTLTGVTAAMNGYQYQCIVSTIVCAPLTSNPATLTVNTPPTITINTPTSLIDTVCAGSTATFGITATGTALTYAWQVSTNSGSTWSAISNGATYTGVTTSTLNIVTTAAMNGYYYRCVVSGTCPPTATSSSFILRLGAVSITTQPASTINLCAGSNGTLTVVAAGNYLSYQWQLSTNSGSTWSNLSNTAPYSGVTTATITLTGVTAGMNANQYRCVISTLSCVGDSTVPSVLTVNSPPSITAYNPTSFMDTVCVGGNAAFTVTATNTTGYQWQVSTNSGTSWANVTPNATYSGVTTNSLSITAVTSTMDGFYYRCVLSDACLPYDTSITGILYVGSVTINTQPASGVTVCSGSNTSISMTATGTHLTYQWQVSTNGGTSWSNITNNAIYSGATSNSLAITAALATMNAYQYRNVISTFACVGDTSSVSTLTVNVAPNVTVPPASQTVCLGTNVTFSVTATGTPSPTYQWYKAGVAISGATSSTYVINNVTAGAAGNYTVSVTNSCGTVSSPTSPAVLAINNPPGITSYTPSTFTNTVCSGTNATFSVAATGAGLNYRWQVSSNGGTTWSNLSNNSTYSNTTNYNLSITTNYGLDGYMYRVVVTGFCSPADTSNPGTLNVGFDSIATQPPTTSSICNNGSGTISVVAAGTHLGYQWQLSTNNGLSWTNIANNATYSNATTANLGLLNVVSGMAGYRYRCVINTIVCTADTTTQSTLSVLTPPNITAYSPVTFTNNICQLSNTYFTVTATGAGLTYQWQVSANSGATWTNVSNNSIYTGAQSNNLGITTSTSLDGYEYRVIVDGTCSPPDTSSVGILNVGAISMTSQPPATTPVCVNGNVSIQATVSGTHLTYLWQVSTNGGTTWSTISNGANYSGATTVDLNVLNFTSAMNGYKYRLIASTTACSPDTSTISTLVSSSSLTAIAALTGCMFEDSAHVHTSVDSNLVLVTISGGTPPYSISVPTIGGLTETISDSLAEYTIPASNATYSYLVTDNAGCQATSNSVTSFAGTPTTIPYTFTHGHENAVCYDSGFMKWLTFVDTADKAILAIFDSSSNLGQLTVTVYKDSTTPEILENYSGNCGGNYAAAMQRHFVLSSTAPQPFSHHIPIRLYFDEQELDSLEVASVANNVPGQSCSFDDDVHSINDLYCVKYDDPRTGHPTENGVYSDNISQAAGGIYKVYGNADHYNTNLYGALLKDSLGFAAIYPNGQPDHYVQLSVTEFSELWLYGSQGIVAPLPVQMLYLEAEAINNTYIQVRWATAIELNNNHFAVERSTDAQNWDSIGVVAGHDYTVTETDYSYNDMNVLPNVRYYYRLKQVDNNGHFVNSGDVTAMIYGTEIFSIKGFVPNPSTGQTKLILTSTLSDDLSIDFYDALGQKILATRQSISPGGNTINFDMNRFAAGVYTAIISGSSGVHSAKLVITR